jgi:hypothetical protein
MSTKKKAARVMVREELPDGEARLVFDRPHNAFKTGMGLMLSSGPHVITSILNKHTLTVRKVKIMPPAPPPDPPLLTRARLALRVLVGNRRPKARA